MGPGPTYVRSCGGGGGRYAEGSLMMTGRLGGFVSFCCALAVATTPAKMMMPATAAGMSCNDALRSVILSLYMAWAAHPRKVGGAVNFATRQVAFCHLRWAGT